MEILDNILSSLPAFNSSASSHEDLFSLTCHIFPMEKDILFTSVIGIIIIACTWIIGYFVYKSVVATQDNKLLDLRSRLAHELAKLELEAKFREATNKFNAEESRKQREWVSESDKLKIEAERIKLREKNFELMLREAEIEGGYPSSDSNANSSKEQPES